MRSHSLLIATLTAVLLASTASADKHGSVITPDARSLSDSELDARNRWLEKTLDGGSTYAKIWQYGWSTGYSLGVVIGTVQATTTSNADTRVSGIVTAAKGVIGTTRFLLAPHPGRLGANPMLAIRGNDREAKLRRLAAGERQLQAVAKRTERRHHWMRHGGNVLLNLIGGAFVMGFGDDTDAAVSTAVGIAVGEVMIFSSPGRGSKDLRSYKQLFAGEPQKSWSLNLVPTHNGAALKLTF